MFEKVAKVACSHRSCSLQTASKHLRKCLRLADMPDSWWLSCELSNIVGLGYLGIKKWYHNIHWEVDVIGKWFHWIISIGGLLGRFTAWQSLYPLVNLHSYGKIHHFQWENPLCISMVIFNSYFDITRGYQSQASVAWTIPNSRGGTLFPTCHRARADAAIVAAKIRTLTRGGTWAMETSHGEMGNLMGKHGKPHL